MSRSAAYPFLTLDEGAVFAEPWMLSIDGRPERELEKWLGDWDYRSRIRLRRRLRLDWEEAADQLQIPMSQLSLSALVTEGTGLGTVPQRQFHLAPLPMTNVTPDILIEHEPDSSQLSHRLHLATSVVLAKVSAVRGRLSPTMAGARVWSDVADTRLEGEEPRFPMEVVSFTAMFGSKVAASKAPWFLQWTPGDLNRDLHGAIRLYLNGDRKDFVDRIISGDAILIQAMLADVISQLIERSISESDDYSELKYCEPGSIGEALMSWINQAWPGESLTAIRSNIEFQPGRMRAAMLAVADVGEMEGN